MTNAQPEDNIELWGRGGWQQYSKDLISSSIYGKSGPLQRALASDSVWCEFWCALQVSDTVGAVWCSSSYRSCTAPRSSTAAVKFLTAELRAKLRKKILTSKKVQTGVHHIIYLGMACQAKDLNATDPEVFRDASWMALRGLKEHQIKQVWYE